MKKIYLTIILSMLLLIAGCSKTSNENQQTTNNQNPSWQPISEPQADESQEEPITETSQTFNINIKSYAFSPAEIRIKKGDTVIWTNNDVVSHTVTSDSSSELNSEALSQEETYSHTFNAQGTYEYYCKPHPFMKAKIIVE